MADRLLSEEWKSPDGYIDALTLTREPDGRLELYVGRWEGDSVTLTSEVAERLGLALLDAVRLAPQSETDYLKRAQLRADAAEFDRQAIAAMRERERRDRA